MDRSPAVRSAVTLEELTALNDEIAALVRVGVPLEAGLSRLGSELPGRMGRWASRVAEQLQQGRPLPEVLADPDLQTPAVYRTVVAAGLRAGRLPMALESMARSTRWLAECRRMVLGNILYPVLVFLIAWGSFVWFSIRVAPVLAEGLREFGAWGQGVLGLVAQCGQTAWYWGPVVPGAVLLGLGVWWFRTARASLAEPRVAGALLGWLPWLGGLFRSLRIATFAEVLGTLLENEIPLDEAVTLAAATSGDRRLTAAADRLAAAIRRGESPSNCPEWNGSACPPLVRWLIAAGQQRGVLLSAVRQAALHYRQRAQRQAELARVGLPIVLTVVFAGGLTLLHALSVFGPWISLMHALTRVGGV